MGACKPSASARKDRAAIWLADKLVRWRKFMLSKLEGWDRNMTNRQRKCVFYTGMLLWSGFLFYLLGDAVRKPPSTFVLPFASDTSAVIGHINTDVRQDAEQLQGQGTMIHQPKKISAYGTK